MTGIGFEDLTGKQFGRLTVLELTDRKTSNGSRIWKCQCNCKKKKIVYVPGYRLKSGEVTSCGCLKRKKGKRVGDLTGKTFGRLTALKLADYELNGGKVWTCQCNCEKKTILDVRQQHLLNGHTQSCGCLNREKIYESHVTHGRTIGKDINGKPRLYNVWNRMRDRCNNKNADGYKNYGGRGISVCKEWEDYAVFEKWALENGYDENAEYGKCTLDRIDVDGNYEPSNCRWVDLKVQANNKRIHKQKMEQEAS